MEKRTWKPLLLLGLFILTTIACGISIDTGEKKLSQEDIDIQQTVNALQKTQTAAAAPPDDGEEPKDDQTDQDSTSDKDSDDGSPCNSSKFVSETIPDGTKFQGGDTFSKSWTIRNAGDCKWTTDYKFVFESGDQMGGSSSMNVPSVIEPGEKITFQVDLKAPSADGDYTGVWRLKAADGEKLGQYWVKITVGSGAAPAPPPVAFAVTSVEFSAPASPIDLICPGGVNVSAKITVNAAGTVNYQWMDSYGMLVQGTLDFAAPGNQTIIHNVLVDVGGPNEAKLYIIDPNNQWFGPKEFDVVCNP